MKHEVSSRDEFDDDADLRTTSSQATLQKQINCHLCYDTYYRHHLHHHDKRSSRNEMADLSASASAFLLCSSSNIGYIVHTPPPQPTPPPPPPPPPPSTITCCCSSCCSTFSCSIPLPETKDMRFPCNLSHIPTSCCSRNNSIKKNNYTARTPSSCCCHNKLPIHNVCYLQPKNYYLNEDKVELYDDPVNEEVPEPAAAGPPHQEVLLDENVQEPEREPERAQRD
ncbi:hypothetical protein V9T40_011629 [Parthenolecanium corni]|uniref:Uncharacterized protein n=1 Tax=Parthenolecanium corni TaxID=536013 RepID=A0AAN9XZP5_9HEMI